MSSSGSDVHSPSPSRSATFERFLNGEDFEPYVRRKKSPVDGRKKTEGLNDEEANILRTSINSRERKRMHDLNDAMDDLRSCLPKIYSEGPGARRLSKINTLILAANRFLHLCITSNRIRQLEQVNDSLAAENRKLRHPKELQQEDVPPIDLQIPIQQQGSARIATPLSSTNSDTTCCAPNLSEGKPLAPLSLTTPLRISAFPLVPFLPCLPSTMCRRLLGQPCTCLLCGGISHP